MLSQRYGCCTLVESMVVFKSFQYLKSEGWTCCIKPHSVRFPSNTQPLINTFCSVLGVLGYGSTHSKRTIIMNLSSLVLKVKSLLYRGKPQSSPPVESEPNPIGSTSFPTSRVSSKPRGRMICAGSLDLTLFHIKK